MRLIRQLAGAISKTIYPGYQGGGILSTVIIGIIRAFVGGSMFPLLRTKTPLITAAVAGLTLPRILVAVLDAIVAINLWGLTKRSSNA